MELDQNQLEQLLVNVIKDAAEASEEDGLIPLRLGEESGGTFQEVEDDGPGLAPEVATSSSRRSSRQRRRDAASGSSASGRARSVRRQVGLPG